MDGPETAAGPHPARLWRKTAGLVGQPILNPRPAGVKKICPCRSGRVDNVSHTIWIDEEAAIYYFSGMRFGKKDSGLALFIVVVIGLSQFALGVALISEGEKFCFGAVTALAGALMLIAAFYLRKQVIPDSERQRRRIDLAFPFIVLVIGCNYLVEGMMGGSRSWFEILIGGVLILLGLHYGRKFWSSFKRR